MVRVNSPGVSGGGKPVTAMFYNLARMPTASETLRRLACAGMPRASQIDPDSCFGHARARL